VQTLTLHKINRESARDYHLIDEESTKRMGFHRELPSNRREIHPRKGVLLGITNLFMRIQAMKIKMGGKMPTFLKI
jgi:hypothetical protein